MPLVRPADRVVKRSRVWLHRHGGDLRCRPDATETALPDPGSETSPDPAGERRVDGVEEGPPVR